MTRLTPNLRQRMALMPGWVTDVVIQAPQQLVWEQVTHFEAYSSWNPFVLEASAQFEVGRHIRFSEDLKQFGQHQIAAQFTEISPPDSFAWRGHFAAPALFSVHHTFELEALGDRQTRFRQMHKNSGLLVPALAWRGVYWVSRQGYVAFDQALKARCEAIFGETASS